MKKILLLGGSAQQVVAIRKAKEMGYYTVLCDYLLDNPGQYVADSFYLVSTTDKESVLAVAKKEGVSGVLAYASDPAAPTAAYVAEKLGLPTNPYESVLILGEKHRFRKYLQKHAFAVPKFLYFSYDNIPNNLKELVEDLQFPVLIKPVDSSGSKGITRIEKMEELNAAIEYAHTFSRNMIIEIEECIQKDHEYLVGGDIFVLDGKVIFWGLLNCHRDDYVNPLVPVGKSYPLRLPEERVRKVRKEIQKLVTSLGIQFGAFNIELIISKADKVYFIEMGPRNGGNMIPDLLGYISGKDVISASIACAMGQKSLDIAFEDDLVFYATHNLHARKAGVLKDIWFSPEIDKYIIRYEMYKKTGDLVEFFDSANKALGIIFLKFESMEAMNKCLQAIEEHINIIIE